MNNTEISLSVPATIYSFGEMQSLTQNKYVTHAKLKVFYVGKTGDKRVFTKQFSDQLLRTLPGTPVVAYYDEEKDDFVGHNYVQYVFGYVPETATIDYIQENGNTFAITDVLLFTGRQDNVGSVANKIIGKPHSLELDPTTIKYTIVRVGNAVDSITFNEGSFIGLSVLGDNEKPAFAGSAFFSEHGTDVEAFINSFVTFKREVELYKSGGKEMETENTLPNQEQELIIQAEEFIEPVIESVETEVVAPAEETVVVETPVEEVVAAEIETDDDDKKEDDEDDEDKEDMPDTPMMAIETPLEIINSEPIVEAQALEGMEDVREQKQKEEEKGEQNAHSAALNEAERRELNEYRKKDKYALIDSYESLGSELKNKYRIAHDQFTIEQLDKELAFELVKSQRQTNKSHGIRLFSVVQTSDKEDSLNDIINRYKDKK